MLILQEIQKKANKLLIDAGVGDDIPIAIEKIAEHLGYECQSFTPDISTIDIAGFVDHVNKKILFNQFDPPKRQRYAIAYEIGHLILQEDQKDYADYWHPKISDPEEKILDYFAGCLLLPEKIFIEQWKTLLHNIDKLAELFNVSTSVVKTRVTALALTSF